jgi:hypothetical protein
MNQSTEKSATSGVGTKNELLEGKEAELLQAFYTIPNIDKAWTSSSRKGKSIFDQSVTVHFPDWNLTV